MIRDYFLGGAAPDGFSTAFWQEQKHTYGFYLKGGPGTGKSTLLKKLAAAFADEDVSVYHCASDPRSLDAVVLEQRGIFAADATAPHTADTPLPHVTGTLIDLAEGLDAGRLYPHKAEIMRLYQENQNAHQQVRKGLAGIAALEEMTAEAGQKALRTEKLRQFAERFAKRLLPKDSGTDGVLLHRQSTALTPLGRCSWIPKDYDLILVQDPVFAASELLLDLLADAAVQAGAVCEVTVSLTRKGQPPVQVLLPEQHIAVSAAHALSGIEMQAPVSVIRMQRFYDSAALRRSRHTVQFCRRSAEGLTERVSGILADALEIHDALEAYYINALDRSFLDRRAEELIRTIAAR